jgi:hypothetical protein
MSSTIIPTNIIPTNIPTYIPTNMLTESVMNTTATPKKRGRPNKYEKRSAVRKAQNASSYAKRKSLQPPKTPKQS